MLRSDMFEDYVGQLQMAAIATISVEAEGREISRQEITARLAPIQQARDDSSQPALVHACPC
jgi:hypothetical protein